MKRFKKIKWDGKHIVLEWTTQNLRETHDHELTSKEEPHADLDVALQALREDVLTIAELEADYGEGLRVQSVTFTHSEKTGIRGAVITCLKAVAAAQGPLVINTPHMTFEALNDDQSRGVLDWNTVARLEQLEGEGWHYLEHNKRAPKVQGELAIEAEPEGAGV